MRRLRLDMPTELGGGAGSPGRDGPFERRNRLGRLEGDDPDKFVRWVETWARGCR